MADPTADDFARRLQDDLRRTPRVRVVITDNEAAVVAQLLSVLGLYTTVEAKPLDRLANELGRELAARLTAAQARAAVVVAPEVAEQIMARRRAGEQAGGIGRDLHMDPSEVGRVVRDAERTERVEP
jgi:hypothetical protein